ncbi:MAG: OmpA family protein [Candidatus Deferrimicrobiaceae bacterium]
MPSMRVSKPLPRKIGRPRRRCGKTSNPCARKSSTNPNKHSSREEWKMNLARWRGMGRGSGILLPLSLIFSLVLGCAPSQMAKDQLERARRTYAQAKANPNVETFAPIQLADSGKAVQKAEQASNSDEMLHLGYLAERKAQIAMSFAEGKMAEKDFEKLNTETALVIAQKREQEAEKARHEAEQARLAAKTEAERAEIAKREAEQSRLAAKTEAERAAIAKREAEQARLAAQVESEKAAKARADTEQLMMELSDLKAKQTERGIVLTIGDVLFAFGKADLSPKADRNVDKLADFLKKYPNRNVLIEGHTDSIGSEEYNLGLSRERSESVKEKLVGDGIEPDRITTVGYGKKYPAVSNDTEANRALNRRVEVIILNEGVKAETQMRQ